MCNWSLYNYKILLIKKATLSLSLTYYVYLAEIIVSEISGCHGDEYEDGSFLVYSAVSSR
jgi:hypothetical protein